MALGDGRRAMRMDRRGRECNQGPAARVVICVGATTTNALTELASRKPRPERRQRCDI